jgi:hypothetical protein
MQKILPATKFFLATMLVGAFAVPASAASFYVMFDNTTKKCTISQTAPTTSERFSMMGIYGSELDAKTAMHGMMKCKG